jgi:hypothetical protein
VDQGKKLTLLLLHSHTSLKFVVSLEWVALGEILMLMWGATVGRNFGINVGRVA